MSPNRRNKNEPDSALRLNSGRSIRAGILRDVSAPPIQITFPPAADPPWADIPDCKASGYYGAVIEILCYKKD